jgi:hypothetical protein
VAAVLPRARGPKGRPVRALGRVAVGSTATSDGVGCRPGDGGGRGGRGVAGRGAVPAAPTAVVVGRPKSGGRTATAVHWHWPPLTGRGAGTPSPCGPHAGTTCTGEHGKEARSAADGPWWRWHFAGNFQCPTFPHPKKSWPQVVQPSPALHGVSRREPHNPFMPPAPIARDLGEKKVSDPCHRGGHRGDKAVPSAHGHKPAGPQPADDPPCHAPCCQTGGGGWGAQPPPPCCCC